MRTSLWCKIELMVLAGTMVLCGVLGGLFLIEGRRDLDRQLDRRIQAIGRYLTEELSSAKAFADGTTLDRELQAAVHDPEINYVIVQAPDGEVLASRWTMLNHHAGVHEYAFPLQQAASGPAGLRTKGRLSIGVDLALLRQELSRLAVRILWQVLLVTLLAVIMIHGFVRTFKRRVRALRRPA